jgi:hypothetical protein
MIKTIAESMRYGLAVAIAAVIYGVRNVRRRFNAA